MTATTSNIASHLVAMAQSQPSTAAIFCPEGRDEHGTIRYAHHTFKQLNQQSDAIAHGLTALGLQRGTRTALCVPPSIEFFAVTFALFKIGAVPVLIDPGIGIKNFGRCLAQAEPLAFIGTPLAHLARRLFGWAKKTIRLSITTKNFGGIPLHKIASRSNFHNSEFIIHNSSDAAILFTSGSTGPAKGVLYTHANFSAQVHALRDTYNLQPGELDLATFPLFGLFGPALGMTTVIPEMDFTRPGSVDPLNIIDAIQQLQITNMFGSPALLNRVGQWGSEHNVKLPSLRRVISAGAPVPANVIARFATMLSPDIQIYTPYGATEALPVCSIGSNEILTETSPLTDQGKGVCVGCPVGQTTVRIIKITDDPIASWSDDLLLPTNQIGEIVVQGPVVTAIYFNNPQATALAKIPTSHEPRTTNHGPRTTDYDFLHRMGDVGYLDERGRLWFCGRKSQRVRLPDGDLFSTPVEAIFNTHPKVYRSALVGVSRNGTMQPVVCIELQPDAANTNQRTLHDELLAMAANHPHTKQIKDFLFHPKFPVDIRHNAKIGREKLALWAQRKLT